MRPSLARAAAVALSVCLLVSGVGPVSSGAPAGPTSGDVAAESTSGDVPVGSVTGDAGTAAAATGGTDAPSVNWTAAGNLETAYVSVEYHEDYAAEADRIASYADEYYELLHQLFSADPAEDRVPIVVGPREDSPCDTAGCVDPLGRIHVSSDSRALVYHELVHTLQLRTHWSPVARLSGPDPLEGAVIEGTATFLDASPAELVAAARFDPDAIELTSYPETGTEYAERALFVEFVLHEYGREAFDALYLEGDVESIENATGTDVETLRAAFEDGLDDQRERLESGGAVLPAFTYEPFVVEPGDEVRFDARTPEAVAAIDRAWYPTEPEAFEWDLTGDGEVDATGPTATRAFDGPGPHEVTLTVTVDGEEYEATQEVTLSDPVSVEDVDLPATVAAGETVVASVTVTNEGNREATRTVSYAVGDATDERTVTLAPGETTTLELEPDLPDGAAGTYDATVSVGTETVEESVSVVSSDDEGDGAEAAESIPGFAAVAALCALLLVALRIRFVGGG